MQTVVAGSIFLPKPPFKHPYMVISDPALDPENVVLVNFTEAKPEEEQCCIAEAGEHRCLTKRSCVRYKDGRVTSVAMLERAVQVSQMTPLGTLSPELLARIRAGASESDFLPEKCRRVLEEQELI
jgi:hypothetical protein